MNASSPVISAEEKKLLVLTENKAAKRRLKSYGQAKTEIKSLESSIRRFREQAASVSSAIGRIGAGSGHSDKVGDNAARISDGCECLQRKWTELGALLEAIEEELQRVKNKQYAAVLRYRYIAMLDWREIQRVMHISEATSFRMHHDALEAYAAIMQRKDDSL